VGTGQPQKQNLPGKPTSGTALSAKPLPRANQSDASEEAVSPSPNRPSGPKPIRNVAPDAIPRPRIPALKPQVGTGAGPR